MRTDRLTTVVRSVHSAAIVNDQRSIKTCTFYIILYIVCVCYFTMPKCPSSKLPSLRKWIEPYNKSGELFKTLNNNSVFCQYCNKVVVVQKKFQIDQHVVIFTRKIFENSHF